MRRTCTAILAAALGALALPAAASADYHRVIQDCSQDGKLDRHYSHGDLSHAYHHIPTDISEYTDCKSVIAAAMENGGGGSSTGAGPGGGAGSGSGGVPTPSGARAASPADASALKSETAGARRAKPAVATAGQTLRPAASGLDHVAGAANELPLPLVVAILAVALLCAVGGIAAAWRRWPALLRAPLRLVRR